MEITIRIPLISESLQVLTDNPGWAIAGGVILWYTLAYFPTLWLTRNLKNAEFWDESGIIFVRFILWALSPVAFPGWVVKYVAEKALIFLFGDRKS